STILHASPLNALTRDTFLDQLRVVSPDIFHRTVHWCRTAEQWNIECLTLLFRAISLWPVLESSSAVCAHQEALNPLARTVDSAKANASVAEADLMEAANDLE